MQFAGASSTGGRRRRRLVVSADGTGVDALPIDGDGTEIESQLVASSAAAPWVPASEMRIWIYAGVIGLLLTLLSTAVVRPLPLPADLDRLAQHLLTGSQPRLLTVVQTLLLGLSTQMCLLITWYRSQCTLDFAGRYRVWPWAVGLLGIATFCAATNLHQAVGEVVSQKDWLVWRPHTVAWALPFCLLSLPIGLLLDRDMRHSRSSFYTLRLSSIQWMLVALGELYQSELQSYFWFHPVRQLLPIFASATLFIGLWLHARIVAYVCPDPPTAKERGAASTLLAGVRKLLAGIRWLTSFRLTRKIQSVPEPEDEEVTKPKRRRKKAVEEVVEEEAEEEAPIKRKRKAPARKTTSRTRTRTKLTEPEEIEPSEEVSEESSYEEAESDYSTDESAASPYEESPYEEQEQWEQEVEETLPEPEPVRSNRRTQVHNAHPAATPAPHSRQEPDWEEEAEPVEQSAPVESESNDQSEDDESDDTSGAGGDQLKGLSKRQRRELKKQQRDRERTRGR